MKKSFLTFCTGILLYSCADSRTFSVSSKSGYQISISDSIPAAVQIANFLQPYKEHIDQEMNAPLAYTPYDLVKTGRTLNTRIGNMMADAVMEMANPVLQKRTGQSIDVVLLNYGGIRASIEEGPITTRSAFEVMPFENEIVVAKMNGKSLRELVRFLIDSGVAHPVAGLELILSSNNFIKKLLVQGEPIENTAIYYVATNDYLFQGGDNMNFFSLSIDAIELDYKIRNILIDYFKKHDTIAPVLDNRFTRLP